MDVALEAGVQDRFRRNRGAAGADFDGDGDVDLFLSNTHDAASLFLNRSDGSSDEAVAPLTTEHDTAASAADYDGDGDPDLYVSCGGWEYGCDDILLRNDGPDPDSNAPVFVDVTDEVAIRRGDRASFGAVWAALDGDLWLDLYVPAKTAADGSNPIDLLFMGRADGGFDEVDAGPGVIGMHDAFQPAVFDPDQDGDLDLFVASYLDENRLLINDGTGLLTAATPDLLLMPEGAFGAVSEDFNADG
ncbi:MAG: VCBS repeat-containing protein [Proteobacteria bacterium]|nr:VCBS repeat-containing protein [Pseudomonadota bacterium]